MLAFHFATTWNHFRCGHCVAVLLALDVFELSFPIVGDVRRPHAEVRQRPAELCGKINRIIRFPTAIAPATAFRLEPFVRLLTAMLIVGLIPLAVMPFASTLQADAFFNRGQGILQGYYHDRPRLSPEQEQQVLRNAAREMDKVLRMQPGNGLAALNLAENYLLQGLLASRLTLEMERQTQQTGPAERRHALDLLRRGVAYTQLADQNLVYHDLEMMRGELFKAMHQLDPRSGYGELYRRTLEATLRLLPHHPNAAYLLAEYLAHQPGSDPARILSLRKLAFAADPQLFFTRYIVPANELRQDQRYARAADLFAQILLVKPDNVEWLGLTAIAQVLAERPEQALQTFSALKQADPILYESAYCGTLDTSLLTGNWQAALDDMHARYAWVTDPDFMAMLRVYEQECRRRLALDDTNTIFQRPATVEPDTWEIMLAETRPLLLRTRFRDPRAALDAVQERLALPSQPEVEFFIEAVYCAHAAQRADLAAQYLTLAAEADPEHPALDDLRALLESDA